jgi:hypothetical protein
VQAPLSCFPKNHKLSLAVTRRSFKNEWATFTWQLCVGDLSLIKQADMTEQLPPRRKPRNDLLRNYYGIGSKAAGNAADAADIGDYLI